MSMVLRLFIFGSLKAFQTIKFVTEYLYFDVCVKETLIYAVIQSKSHKT